MKSVDDVWCDAKDEQHPGRRIKVEVGVSEQHVNIIARKLYQRWPFRSDVDNEAFSQSNQFTPDKASDKQHN